MKVYFIALTKDTLPKKAELDKLSRLVETEVLLFKGSLSSIAKLKEDKGDKILAIDPDFCDWKITNEDLDQIPNIKSIVLGVTSYGWIDTKYLAQKGIPVVNVAGYSTNAVAEAAVTSALNISRRLPLIIKSGWKQDYAYMGYELAGKTVGVVGMGNIGTRIAEICAGLGMDVQYWSMNTRDKRYTYTSLNKLCKTSDVIFPALSDNHKTKNFITDAMIKSFKKEAIFVSMVSGIYNKKLVVKRVGEGRLYGCGFEDNGETSFEKHKGNILAMPMLGWYTKESMERNIVIWTESICAAIKGQYPRRIN